MRACMCDDGNRGCFKVAWRFCSASSLGCFSIGLKGILAPLVCSFVCLFATTGVLCGRAGILW